MFCCLERHVQLFHRGYFTSGIINKDLSVGREIEVLKAILNTGIPGAPMVSAFLQSALHIIESQGTFPELTDHKGRQTLDSLGGGNIL